MSAYGIEAFNDYGYNLIDNNFKNMVLRHSGHIYSNQFSFNNSYYHKSATIYLLAKEYKAPLVFVRSITESSKCNVSCTCKIINNEAVFMLEFIKWHWVDYSGSIEYYIFDDYRPQVNNEYGLSVYDDNGEICFNGDWHFLNLTDVYPIPPNYPNYSRNEFAVSLGTFSPNKKLAACMPLSRLIISWLWEESDSVWLFKECIWIEPNRNEVSIAWSEYCPIDQVYLQGLPDMPHRPITFVQFEQPSLLLMADVGKLPIPYNPLTIL